MLKSVIFFLTTNLEKDNMTLAFTVFIAKILTVKLRKNGNLLVILVKFIVFIVLCTNRTILFPLMCKIKHSSKNR